MAKFKSRATQIQTAAGTVWLSADAAGSEIIILAEMSRPLRWYCFPCVLEDGAAIVTAFRYANRDKPADLTLPAAIAEWINANPGWLRAHVAVAHNQQLQQVAEQQGVADCLGGMLKILDQRAGKTRAAA